MNFITHHSFFITSVFIPHLVSALLRIRPKIRCILPAIPAGSRALPLRAVAHSDAISRNTGEGVEVRMIDVVPEIVESGGKRMVKVTLQEGGKILDADVVNPLHASQRRRVAKQLAQRAGDVGLVEGIEAALLEGLRLIQEAEGAAAAAAEAQAAEEEQLVDAGLPIVRPDLFIDAAGCGMSLPEMAIRSGQASGRWRLYVRWGNGQRASALLARCLQGPAGQRLWVHPWPPPPTLPLVPAWSEASRGRFLEGAQPPSAREVFEMIYGAMGEYLDMGEERDEGAEGRRDEGSETSAAPSSLRPSVPPSLRPSVPSSLCPSAPSSLRPSVPSSLSSQLSTLALWTMLTYCFPAWEAVPYLHVSGPAGSGKTRVFELLSRMALRPIVSSNLSAPALFRTLHEKGGTLLLDEADWLGEGSPEVAELRSILLAGYKRGGRATRLESVGEGGFQMAEFLVFGPKAVACIAGLPGPLLSRCIPFPMLRSAPDSPKPRKRLDEVPQRWQQIRDALHELALGSMGPAAIELAKRADLCSLSGRHHELWQPILALAEWVDPGGALRARLEEHAKSLIVRSQEELVADEEQALLRALCELVIDGKTPTTKEVLEKARRCDERMFKKWTASAAAAVFRRYGFMTTRTETRREYRNVTIEQFKAIERSYGFELNTSAEKRVRVLWRQY